MDYAFELQGLEKVYRSGFFRKPMAALRGLTLSAGRGEIFGIVGPNGAGKTTAFKILLGLLRPTAGTATLLGRPAGDPEGRRRLGFLPELPAYYPHLTVGEVLRFARALSGLRASTTEDRHVLEELGLGALEARPIRRLSKGQVQRVGLAQALVHRPDLLILDEPMSGLDPLGRALVKERLLRERASGTSVVLSSHVLADVEALADSIALISAGKLLLQGKPQELLSQCVDEVAILGSGALPEGILESMPEGSAVSGDANAWTLRLARPEGLEVDACLRRVLGGGARIHSLETRREDLERFLVRRLDQERMVSQGRDASQERAA